MPRLCPPTKLQRALDLLEEDPGEGLDRLEDLAAKYAKDPDVRYAYGVALLDEGLLGDAVAHLEFAERKQPTPEVRDVLLEAYVELGMPVHAERLLKRAGRTVADEFDAPAEIARVHGPSVPGVTRQDRLELERAFTEMRARGFGALGTLDRLVARRPDWLAARNALAAALLAHGEMARYIATARETFERAPHDVHAVLNATRAALLAEGREAARAYRPYLDAATSHRTPANAALGRAQAAALMDDPDALDEALSAHDERAREQDEDPYHGPAETLHDALERRSLEPGAPLVTLMELLGGLLGRWMSGVEDDVERAIGDDLAALPGLLRELPARIGFEPRPFARLLTHVLISEHAPPSPEAPWPEVLERVGRHGPGSEEARVALLMALADAGLVDESVPHAFDGEGEEGLTFHRFEVTDEPVASGLSEEDQKRFDAVMHEVVEGRTTEALEVLSELARAYPDSASVAYNLATAERLAGGEGAERARDRLERIIDEHPDYLFARAQLAVDAVEEGDLQRAESLLAVPQERRRLHRREWASFAAAQGRVALAHGHVDGAESYLSTIGELMGEDAPSYRMLEDAIDAQVLAGVPEADVDGTAPDEADVLPAGTEEEDLEAMMAPEGFAEALDPPTLEEMQALPRLEGAWTLATAAAAFPIGDAPDMSLLWVAALVAEDGYVRALQPFEAPLGPEEAYAFVAHACTGASSEGEPGRPRRLVIADDPLANQLKPLLDDVGIGVRVGDEGPARQVIEGMAEALGSGAPPWLTNVGEEEAEAFLDAAEAFFDAEPWEVFEPDRPLAFRVGEGPWRYATVMGLMGEELGLALFEDWRQFQAFASAEGDPAAAVRHGDGQAVESLSLAPPSWLSPLDAARYVQLGYGPGEGEEVAAQLSLTPDGFTLPRYRPGVYAALLTLLAERAERARRRVRRIDASVDTLEGPMRVIYPATGGEAASEPPRDDVPA